MRAREFASVFVLAAVLLIVIRAGRPDFLASSERRSNRMGIGFEL